jgi:Ca2+-binding RTX toxin-like protein
MAIINGTGDAETLKGGAGNDTITGFAGYDLVFGGGGNDVFVWNTGDGNDTVQGGAGFDTFRYATDGSDDSITLAADGSRASVFNFMIGDYILLNDVERLNLRTGDGSDNVWIRDLSATDVKQVAVDLAGSTAGVPDGNGDSVEVWGSDGNETITVALASGRVSVTGVHAPVTIANAEADDLLYIEGGSGNDVINASKLAAGIMTLSMYGGEGHDRITGSKGNDSLEGDAGNDTITGGRGDDTMLGGAGNDLFAWSAGDGSDQVDGQVGVDTVRFTGSISKETMTIGAIGGGIVFTRDGLPQVAANDVERVQIRALAGADTITINDLAGSDVQRVTIDLAATAGGALADANVDTVEILGSGLNDTIDINWTGSAVRVAGLVAETDIAHAGSKDVLKVTGGVGNDILNAAGVPAGKMSLRLLGDAGDDTIFGSAGNDIVTGGAGNDLVYLGAGNDRFIWNFPDDGVDKVDGQTGLDTLQFGGSANGDVIYINGMGERTFVSHSGVIGVDLNDVETIQVQCGTGADYVGLSDLDLADAKRVTIDLGAGDGKSDTVQVNGGDGNEQIAVAMSNGVVSVTGLPVQLTIAHVETGDTLFVGGGDGNDVITAASLPASAMTLVLTGWDGNDTITGNGGDNTLGGDKGNDTLRGGGGTDLIYGGLDNDLLDGGTGGDLLAGEAGNDRIVGNRGDDTISGGLGNDTFFYNSVLDGHDVISDFDGDAVGGQDVLNLDALFDALGIANGSRAGRVELTDNGGTVDIRVNADGNGGNGFELHVATLTTADNISVGQDIIVAG